MRTDHYTDQVRTTITAILPTREEAAAEVDRLNRLRLDRFSRLGFRNEGGGYEVIQAKWFPEGRNVQIGY